MIDKSLRYNYQWGGPGGKSPGASSSGGGGHDRGGQQHQATARAAVQAAKSQPVARSAPDPYRGGQVIVHTPPKTEYITKKEPTIVAPITRDVMPIVPTATKRPTEMLDIAGDIKAQQKLQEDIRESQRTGAYAKELGLPSIKRDGKLIDLTDLRDDAKTQQVQILQKKADLSWQNKSMYEKEEQQEKWDAAESKIKLQKEGGFWKSLGNIAMAMVLPALLPAKLVKGYNLYKTVKSATAFAKKIGITDQDVMQIVKQKYFGGKDISSQIAGKENVIAKNIAQFTGQGDDLSDIEGQQAVLGKLPLIQLRNLQKKQGMEQFGGEKLTPKEKRMLDKLKEMQKEEKVYKLPILTAADGGRIDSPLMGGNRYI